MNHIRKAVLPALICAALVGCANSQPPLATVDYVDLNRFMGDWYVIANIPTFLERNAFNAVETYEMNSDGTIATTFVYRKGGFDGKRKQYNPRGFVTDTESNAIWGMRFIWPIKADYRIVYLEEDYSLTVIARNKRDYVWVMAKTPSIADAKYAELVEFISEIGYDTGKLRKVPQQWK